MPVEIAFNLAFDANYLAVNVGFDTAVLADRNVILLQVYLTLNASLDHEVFVAAEISLDGNRRTDGCPFLAKLGWVASRLRGCGRLWLGVICI